MKIVTFEGVEFLEQRGRMTRRQAAEGKMITMSVGPDALGGFVLGADHLGLSDALRAVSRTFRENFLRGEPLEPSDFNVCYVVSHVGSDGRISSGGPVERHQLQYP